MNGVGTPFYSWEWHAHACNCFTKHAGRTYDDAMNDALDRHPLFTKWEDPDSGVINYILSERLAPIQRGNYFATPSISGDGKWLWFKAIFPPSTYSLMGVVSLDPDDPQIRTFPHAAAASNPLVNGEDDTVYVPMNRSIHRLDPEGNMKLVFEMPSEIIEGRHLFRLVTDLTVSCDGKHLLLDSWIGDRTLISVVELATGELTPIKWLDRDLHHSQFSPHDPTLFMLGESPWMHPITGIKTPIDRRIWIMDTSGDLCEALFDDLHFGKNCWTCHEWWTPEGHVQWCDYETGIFEADIETRERKLVWEHPMIHGQTDPTGRFICGDHDPYKWSEHRPCGVYLYDRETGKDIALASAMPLPEQRKPDARRRPYHLDPHPHFSPDSRYVVYTGTVLGPTDVILASVPSAVARM